MAAPSNISVAASPVLSPQTSAAPASVRALQRREAIMEATEDIMYGSLAGIVGKYIEYPFDTVKVRLQSQPDHLPLRYRGPLDCFRQSIRADGLLGLYRGISAPLLGAALETSSLFSFERLGRETLVWSGLCPRDTPLSLPALWFTGAFSGIFTSFILTPVELVKCKIQVAGEAAVATGQVAGGGSPTTTAAAATAGTAAQHRPLAVIRAIYRHDGLLGFWHGQLGTLIREAGGCAAWFGSKETTSSLLREWNVRSATTAAAAAATASGHASAEHARDTERLLHRLRNDPLPLWQQALAGASAGMSYNFLFFPADTVKSRMQTAPTTMVAATATPAALVGQPLPGPVHQQHRQRRVRRTFWAEAKALWNQAGIRGFYRGCGVTVARSAPSSAFIFMVYDGLKSRFPLA